MAQTSRRVKRHDKTAFEYLLPVHSRKNAVIDVYPRNVLTAQRRILISLSCIFVERTRAPAEINRDGREEHLYMNATNT